MNRNFIINNKSAEVATIDIIGDIGESWFSEGITLESVKSQLDQITAKKIEVNISSFGGAVSDAFGIYYALKNHKAKVTTKIIAPTASSGTIVFMAGDEREIYEPSVFLAHNIWTSVSGNAEELRQEADNLEKFDNQLVSIYMSSLNKSENELRELMSQDKWIEPNETLEWGFSTAVKQSGNKQNALSESKKKEIIAKLQNKYVSKMIKEFEFVNNALGNIEGLEQTEEGIYLSKEQIETLNSNMKTLTEEKEALEVDQSETIANKIEEATTELNGKIETITNELETEKQKVIDSEEKLNTVNSEKETLQNKVTEGKAKIENLEKDLKKANAKSSVGFFNQPDMRNAKEGEPKISGGAELEKRR